MDRTLYLECESGISGDMSVAMLLDLGADREVLAEALKSLPLQGYEIRISRVNRNGIDCCDFDVVLEEENHDHDMEYLYGEGEGHTHAHEHEHAHEHTHEHEHEHTHEHEHEHSHGDDHAHAHHHSHAHVHRHLAEINRIIDAGNLTDGANALAKKIFRIIAEAESRAHNLPLEKVGFHEVGAVDSIVDIVAFAVCFDNLDIRRVLVPKLCEGTGVVRCQHGILPVPVPAVTNILEGSGIPMEILPYKGEFVTPTGAAIVKAVRTGGGFPAGCTIARTGMGAGKRQTERANVLRGMLLESADEASDSVWKLESDIDDTTGEVLGYTLERLLEAGAKDVHYLPCFMKKNRPAWQLQVICDEEHRSALERIIFRETTTIGIRRIRMERSILKRQTGNARTPFGNVRIKICRSGDETYFYPEYEDVAAIAREKNVPFQEVYRAAQQSAREL